MIDVDAELDARQRVQSVLQVELIAALALRQTTYCAASCTWFCDQVKASVQGQWLQETSSLMARDYAYDQVGRLIRVEDAPAGRQCTVRDYTYSNRIRTERHSLALDGGCDTHDACDHNARL